MMVRVCMMLAMAVVAFIVATDDSGYGVEEGVWE